MTPHAFAVLLVCGVVLVNGLSRPHSPANSLVESEQGAVHSIVIPIGDSLVSQQTT